MKPKSDINIVNRKATYDYEVLDKYVCGMQLFGSEVKGIRMNQVVMKDSFCTFIDDELFVRNLSITPPKNNSYSHEVNRNIKLLLKKSELTKLDKGLIKGYSIIPLSIHTNERGFIKMTIGLCRGKKLYDKKETMKERDLSRFEEQN